MSKATRASAVMDYLRGIERQRNFGCQEGSSCRSRNEGHNLLWHTSDDVQDLIPHPLLEKVGGITELVSNILSHLNDATLFSAARVSKKWNTEAVRFLWHTITDEGRLLATSLADDRVDFHAALIRHFVFTGCAYRDDQWGWSYPTSTTRKAPALPGLSSLTCNTWSLSERSVAELDQIFLPTLKTLKIGDDVAFKYFHNHQIQLPNVSWFDTMTANCKRLTSMTIGRNSCIKWRDFDGFLKSAIHLKSVELGSYNEYLLIDRLAPILKSAVVDIRGDRSLMTTWIYEQLPKMHALEHLDINAIDCDITGQHLLPLNLLTCLKRFTIRHGNYSTSPSVCTVTVEELAVFVQTKPDLDVFAIWLTCDFVKDLILLTHDDLWGHELETYFPAASSRQQYLDYLYSVIGDKAGSALCMFEHLPFCLDQDA